MTLITNRCHKCGVIYGIDEDVYRDRVRLKTGFYCTNGHEGMIGENEADRLRRERDRLAQQKAQLEDDLASANRKLSLAATKAKKLKRRIGGGSCPCCTRTFQNLRSHMKTKHPEYIDKSNVVPIKGKALPLP